MRSETFRSHHRRQWAGLLLLLLAQWFLFASRSVAQAQPSYVQVMLSISVAGKDKATPDSWEISILRDGTLPGGTQLKEIKAVVEKGKINPQKTSPNFELDGSILRRPETDFQLTRTLHKITVRADGFQLFTKELSDDDLRQAFSRQDKILEIAVELTSASTNTTIPTPTSPDNGTKSNEKDVFARLLDFSKQIGGKLHYAFWLLGLVGVSLFLGWVVLVLLTRVFHKYGVERRTLQLAPWLARGLIWPFGFRLTFSLNHKDMLPDSVLLLQTINRDLFQLREISNVARPASPEPRNIVRSLANLANSNIGAPEIQGYLEGIEASLVELSNRKPATATEAPKDDSLKSTVKDAVKEAFLEGGFVPKHSGSGGEKDAGAVAGETVASPHKQPLPDHSHEARAKVFYQLLLNHQPLDCKPIFLEADAKGSILGRLADDSVYLMQVGSSQAPFIVFLDDNDDETTGWVFPNPAQAFDKSTLRDVFPSLSEAEFNETKEGIEPAAVIKDGEKRWRVDRETWVR